MGLHKVTLLYNMGRNRGELFAYEILLEHKHDGLLISHHDSINTAEEYYSLLESAGSTDKALLLIELTGLHFSRAFAAKQDDVVITKEEFKNNVIDTGYFQYVEGWE